MPHGTASQEDLLGSLLLSTVMTEIVNGALRRITSEVQALSYVDDTVLIGPADAVNNALQQLPALLRATGLEPQPTRPNTSSGRRPGAV